MYDGASQKRFKPLDRSQFQDFVRVKGVHITLLSPEEIRRMSVTEVKTDQIYNKNQLPMAHGAMAPTTFFWALPISPLDEWLDAAGI